MRHIMIGASALAILAACGADDSPNDKAKDAVKSVSESLEISDIKVPELKFKAKDYGQTAEVLAALKLDGESNEFISFADSSTAKGGAVFKDVSIKPKDENGKALIAKTMTFDGLNMTDEGPSFDRLVLSDMSLVDEEEGVNLAIGDISIVEPNAAASQFFASLIQGEEPEDVAPFSEWAFDRLSLSDLTLSATPKEEDGSISATIGELSMSSLAEAVAGNTLFSDIKIDFDIQDGDMPMKGNLNLDKLSLANMQASFFDTLAEASSDPEAIAGLNEKLMADYTSPIDQGYDQGVVEGLSFDVSGLSFSMPRSATKVVRDKNGVATQIVSPKTEFKLSADAEGGQIGAQLAQALAMLDYTDLEFAVEAKASYDPETQETRYDDYVIGMKDGFELSFNGGAFGLLDAMKGLSSGEPGEAPNMDALSGMKFSDMEISLEDKSLLDRAFKVGAQMQGMEPAQLKSMATGFLAMGSMQMNQSGVDTAIVNQVVGAITTFVEDSGTLTIKLAPEAPIAMSDFEDPSKLTVESLGFSAETK